MNQERHCPPYTIPTVTVDLCWPCGTAAADCRQRSLQSLNQRARWSPPKTAAGGPVHDFPASRQGILVPSAVICRAWNQHKLLQAAVSISAIPEQQQGMNRPAARSDRQNRPDRNRWKEAQAGGLRRKTRQTCPVVLRAQGPGEVGAAAEHPQPPRQTASPAQNLHCRTKPLVS